MASGRLGLLALVCASGVVVACAQGRTRECPRRAGHPWPDARIQVSGLAWFSEDRLVLRRLPARLGTRFPKSGDWPRIPPEGAFGFAPIPPDCISGRKSEYIADASHDDRGAEWIGPVCGWRYRGSTWPDDRGRIECEGFAVQRFCARSPCTFRCTMGCTSIPFGWIQDPAASFSRPRPSQAGGLYGSSITQEGTENTGPLSW